MIRVDMKELAEGRGWTVFNRRVHLLREGLRDVARFDEGLDAGLAIWRSGDEFANGTIECDLRGKNIHQRSFLGFAFHGTDENTFDLIYFRPFNFRSEDPERRAHSVQYCSFPTYDWYRLRREHTGKYEHAVQPAPDPDAWFHVRMDVQYPRVSVYINDAKQEQSITINQLSDRKKGWIGLWVGPNSGGDFAKVDISTSQLATVHTVAI